MQEVEVSDEWWLDVARHAPAATFFHTPHWTGIAGDVLEVHADRTRGFELDSGVRAVVPMVGVGRPGRMQHLMSTAEGCYGGLIADGPVSSAEVGEIHERVLGPQVLSYQFLESPLAQYELPEAVERNGSARHDSAWLVDLDPDFDRTLASLPRRVREYYRSGMRKGVTVSEATDIGEYRGAYEAYLDAIDRWGESPGYGYDWPVFERLHSAAVEHPALVKLWVMRVGDAIAGGRLVFYWNDHAVLWHGTARREFLPYRVIPIADIEIMRDAAARGLRWYDLNTTGDQLDVITYKRRMSAREVPLRIWRYDAGLASTGNRLRRAAGRWGRRTRDSDAWRRLMTRMPTGH